MQRLADELKDNPKVLLHYDGKKFDEDGNFIERLPIVASGFGSGDDYILKTPFILDGKAKTVAKKVHDVAVKSGVMGSGVGQVTDTTSTMSGPKNGALLEF